MRPRLVSAGKGEAGEPGLPLPVVAMGSIPHKFRLLVDGVIRRQTGTGGAVSPGSVIAPPRDVEDPEPPEEVKREVIRRDGGHCLCCGNTRRLQVDHIISRYHGGTNDPSNLQTLCSICNRDKSIREMHFRKTGTLLKSAPPLQFPAGFNSANLDDLAHDIQRTINMFYQCAAVDEIEIKSKGIKRREWRIRLRSNNPRAWFEEHLLALFNRARAAQADDRYGPVRSLVLEAPMPDETFDGSKTVRVCSDEIGKAKHLSATEIRPRMSVAVYCPLLFADLPNQPVRAKVIRIDASNRQADVRATIGRSDLELTGVPFKAIFDPDAVLRDDEQP